MRVFVTGATGTIGSVVVPELIAAGHEVLALARSDKSAQSLAAAGIAALRGDLDDPASLRAGAARTDGVLHLAFSHDGDRSPAGFQKSMTQEATAVETFGAALEGSGKPLVIASGTSGVPGRASTEQDPPITEGPVGGRGRNAQTVLGFAARGVRSAVVRLPRSVHARGERSGFASVLVETARRTGISGYVGDGTQRWPAVHRLDAARLFRLVLERAEPGTVAHAVGDEGDPMRSIAEVIGRVLGLPVQAVPTETFGILGNLMARDQPSSSAWTRETFDWRPSHPSLLADLEAGGYPA
jgi:nucleoside-diphosphate-sugar epimerase